MKSPASTGLVSIAVNPAEEDVCRIGIAVGESEQARVRALTSPWHVFAERSVADPLAVEAELCRRLDHHPVEADEDERAGARARLIESLAAIEPGAQARKKEP